MNVLDGLDVDLTDTKALVEAIKALSLRERSVPYPMRDVAANARIKALEVALDRIWEH